MASSNAALCGASQFILIARNIKTLLVGFVQQGRIKTIQFSNLSSTLSATECFIGMHYSKSGLSRFILDLCLSSWLTLSFGPKGSVFYEKKKVYNCCYVKASKNDIHFATAIDEEDLLYFGFYQGTIQYQKVFLSSV